MEKTSQQNSSAKYIGPLFAGALAGLSVDLALYPLDTLKTRVQSQQGFYKAGGFRGVYKGLLTVASTSMPTSALFFVSYETTKTLVQPLVLPHYTPVVHMLGASIGIVLACVIKVPTEVAKQRKQTDSSKSSSIRILVNAYKLEGFFKGVYRGSFSTVARDLPFSFIEMPVWEMLKSYVRDHNNGQINGFQSAICGSIAGGFAAAVTTPLDLAKTRIMLASEDTATRRLRIKPVLTGIYLEGGVRGLFTGVLPRTAMIMSGAFIFFGVYDESKALIENHFR